MHLTNRQRKLLKWLGYPLLAIVTFIFTLAYTFPYDRLEDKIVEGLRDKYDVSIQSIEPTLVPGTFVINRMVLRSRPKTAEEKPVIVMVDEIEINIGVVSAIFWTIDMAKLGVEIEAKIGGGTLGLALDHDRGDNTLVIAGKTKRLPIASLPGVAEAVGLPMAGALTAQLDIELPRGKWSNAEGEVSLTCIGCTVGDGVAKMKMKPRPGAKKNSRRRRAALFQGAGLTVPKLNLGAVSGTVEINKGKGLIKTLAAKSNDGFLNIDGEILFKDPFKESLFPGCMTFGFSEDLKERHPKFMGIEAGLPPKSKQADGSYAIPTKGKFVELRFDVRRQCGASEKKIDAKRERPRISTRDKDEEKVDDKVEPRKMPEMDQDKDEAKEAAKGEEAAEGDDVEASKLNEKGPTLSRGIKGIEERAEALEDEEEDPEEDDEEAVEDDEADEEAEDEGGEGEEEETEGDD